MKKYKNKYEENTAYMQGWDASYIYIISTGNLTMYSIKKYYKSKENIARGPEIDSVTWTNFALVSAIWPTNGATWISSKFYDHLAPLELDANLAI